MIDVIDRYDLRHLAEAKDPHSVSIYLPTHSAGAETNQNPIRFKNQLTEAHRQLSSLGMKEQQIDDRLSEASSLIADHQFWNTTGSGLAVFVNAAETRTYRLPVPVPEIAVVADRFHLKPLVPAVASGGTYYMLALSKHEVRLLQGSRHELSEVSLGGIPSSSDEVLGFDDREPQLQSHSAGRTGGGGTVAVFHGQGAGKDMERIDLERFLRAVDTAFRNIVGGVAIPLVLCGVDGVVAHFRKVSHYQHIADGAIKAHPEPTDLNALHRQAWPLVESSLDAPLHAARAAITEESLPHLVTLSATVLAAHEGRVDSLFVPSGIQRWGTFDSVRRAVETHENRLPGDRDLFDVAAVDTLTHGGNVFVVAEPDIPSAAPVAATLRY